MKIERVEVSHEKSLVMDMELISTGTEYDDGIHTVFLSTKGRNEEEVPKELVKFLKFVKANLSESTGDFGDELVKRLQDTIQDIKLSREITFHSQRQPFTVFYYFWRNNLCEIKIL